MADQMDARCKVVKKIPSNKLMPMLEKGESVVNNPGELKGKLPAEMGKIYKSLKGVVGKSGGLDYCNKGNRDELMQKMQSSVMPYLFPVKGAYDKHCEDYAKFVEGPSGAALMKEMSALIEKSMA